jgi:hypothetical protein
MWTLQSSRLSCPSCLSNKRNSNCYGNLHCTDGRHGQSILAQAPRLNNSGAHALASEAPLPSRLSPALGPHIPVNILQSCGQYLSKVRARHLQSSTSRANVSAVTVTSPFTLNGTPSTHTCPTSLDKRQRRGCAGCNAKEKFSRFTSHQKIDVTWVPRRQIDGRDNLCILRVI